MTYDCMNVRVLLNYVYYLCSLFQVLNLVSINTILLCVWNGGI